MKETSQYFAKKNILFKELKEILPKELNSKKKIKIFVGSSTDLKFYAIFVLSSKSRFIKKSSDELENLYNLLVNHQNHNFRVKTLFIQSEICSKTKQHLKDSGWTIVEQK